MTKLTVAQMREELDRERTARLYQEKEIAQLRYTVEDLRTQLTNVTSVASAVNTMQQPAWRMEANARRTQMNAARDAAMQQSRMIKV